MHNMDEEKTVCFYFTCKKIHDGKISSFLARRGRMSLERYCHTPGVVVVVVVVVVVGRCRRQFQVKVFVY